MEETPKALGPSGLAELRESNPNQPRCQGNLVPWLAIQDVLIPPQSGEGTVLDTPNQGTLNPPQSGRGVPLILMGKETGVLWLPGHIELRPLNPRQVGVRRMLQSILLDPHLPTQNWNQGNEVRRNLLLAGLRSRKQPGGIYV